MSDPAFPNGPDITGGQFAPHGGMTQRQYYKAQALAGLMANPAVVMYKNNDWMLNGKASPEVARWCGRMANAMIAEDAEHEAK